MFLPSKSIYLFLSTPTCLFIHIYSYIYLSKFLLKEFLTWVWKLASPKPTRQVRGKRPREELVLLFWVWRKPGTESFRSSTISYWKEWLHSSWGPVQMKMQGPLLKKKLKNFKMAAIEHDTRHKALKCGASTAVDRAHPCLAICLKPIHRYKNLLLKRFAINLCKCARCFLPGPWCLQAEWNWMRGLECQSSVTLEFVHSIFLMNFTFRRVYRLWNILKRL